VPELEADLLFLSFLFFFFPEKALGAAFSFLGTPWKLKAAGRV